MKQSQDKLGQMPVGKLLITMSVPMMVSMFIQALYNVVDSMFVARLCEDALTAVSLAFPLQNIMNAVGIGTAIGINALVPRALGAGDRERAEKAANVMVFLCLCYTAAAVVLGLTFSRTFYENQTDVQSIIDYGEQYVSVICVWSMGMFFSLGFEKLLVATGNSTAAMLSQALGAVVNIIFDPILIFGFGPIHALGVRGAAIATVTGQFSAALCALLLNLRFNRATRFSLRHILPTVSVLKDIYAVGIPSMITVGLISVTGYFMNSIFLSFSTTAAAVYGIWLKLQNFGLMPVFGLNNGTMAIYSYNHGAGKIDRVLRTFRLSVIWGAALTLFIALVYALFPVPLLRLFSASEFMMSFGVRALRICVSSLAFGAVSIIISSACQSLGRARFALFINVLRNLVLPVATAWLLSRPGKLELVWFSPLFAEILTLAAAVLLAHRVLRGLKDGTLAPAWKHH